MVTEPEPSKVSFCSMAAMTTRGGFIDFAAALLEGFGHGDEDAAEAGATVAVDGREIGAAEKRFALGGEEGGKRPAALAADGGDGGLVAGVDVGALVAIDLDGDEVLVDDGERFRGPRRTRGP